MITLNVDAAITDNPGGLSSYGWVLHDGSEHIASDYGLLPEAMTINEGEYLAVIEGLVAAIKYSPAGGDLRVLSDSKLFIYTVTEKWKLKAKNLIPFRRVAQTLADHFDDIEFQWIPREQNSEADALTEKALYEKGMTGRRK